MGHEIDRRVTAAGVVLHVLHHMVVTKRELSWKAKLSIYQSIFVRTLTYGHERWVMTERMRLWVQAAVMGFLRRVAGVSLRVRVWSSAIEEALGVERSQLRWFGHLVRSFLGRCFWHVQHGGDLGVEPGPGGGIISLLWPGSAWGFPSRVSRCGRGKGSLGLTTEAAAPATRFWISGWQWMDGWIMWELVGPWEEPLMEAQERTLARYQDHYISGGCWALCNHWSGLLQVFLWSFVLEFLFF